MGYLFNLKRTEDKMKRIVFFLVFLVFLLFLGCEKELPKHSHVEIKPSNPQPNQSFTVIYTPGVVSPLADSDSVTLQVLFIPRTPTGREILEKGVIKEIPMHRKGISWQAGIKSTEQSGCIELQFKSGDKLDNNRNKGWDILLYDANGKPVEGAYSALSQAYGDGIVSFLMGLKKFNADTAMVLFRKELELYPENLRARVVSIHLRYGKAVKENDKKGIRQLADELSAYIKAYPQDIKVLELAYTFFYRTDPQKAKKVLQKIEKLDAGHRYVLSNKMKSIRKIKDIKLRVKKLSSLELQAGKSDSYFTWSGYMLDNLSALQRWDAVIELANRVIKKLETNFPVYPSYSREKIQKSKQSKLYVPLKALAVAYHKTGQETKAEKSYDKLLKLHVYPHQRVALLEDYIQFLIDTRQWDKAADTALEAIKTANASEKIENLFKKAYLEKTKDAETAEQMIQKAKQASGAYRKKELAKTMITDPKPAPQFTLPTLDGKEISLAELRGKTVIVDFWATWCSPCKASFPFLQKFWEQHKDDPNLALFAVNTREQLKGEKRVNSITKFMQTNGYTFPVLLDDTESSVMKAFEVGGIPTKFFIGPDGKIYFKEIGFHGPGMVEDMNLQLELIREKMNSLF